MATSRHGVLVGYDGSTGSEQAILWAVREARARAEPLTVCVAWAPGSPAPAEDPLAGCDPAKRSGDRTLAYGAALAQALYRDGEVWPLLVRGSAAEVLCKLSANATMTVVGARGHSSLAGLLSGSVSSKVAAHAHGPVVVVRGHWPQALNRPPGPVVVGCDGSPQSEPAVEFAFTETGLHGGYLLAVCALADAPGVLGAAHHIKEAFTHQLDRWQKEYPDVTVRRYITDGPARPALLDAVRNTSQLVVVGARGRGGLPAMQLGSVSHALLNHAPCPVSIVHACAEHDYTAQAAGDGNR